MALTSTDWTVDRATGDIRYIGDDHHEAAPSYATVIEFHRWLQSLADDAVATGDDELDITNTDPSRRSTDNIVTLINGYNITDTEAEHLYDGSIIYDDGDEIYDGIVNFGNVDVQIQIIQNGAVLADDFWNYSEGGTHTGAGDASTLTDSAQSWTPDEWIGYTIYNTTDGSSAIITDNDATTITATLEGGTENDWDASDAYLIGAGLNPSVTAGISHRFMIKVRTSGADVDGRRLVGTSRRYGFTYSSFKINGTSRGNNVLALTDSTDLNNTTSIDTTSTWTTITNTEGYANMDVDNNSVDEYYYSEWDKDSYTINQFYERMKWLQRDGSTSTLYGLNGELFRGITHQVAISSPSGTFVEPESLSWGTGATAGTGQLLAIDSTTAGTAMWIQLLTGVVPNANTITGNGGGTATAGTVTERTTSKPFCGVSTGSAIIGAYGFGIETTDLTATDKVTNLANVVMTPPNNVQNTVGGLVSGEDRVLVAPYDGSTPDANGDPAIDKDQLSLGETLTSANVSTITVSESIPTDTPSTGVIRVTDDDGYERWIPYSSWTTSTFTVNTGHADIGSNNDFDGAEGSGTYQATTGNDVYIAYIDILATGTTATFTSVQSGSRNLVVIVRDGASTPIKQFISSWSQTTSPQTITAIRTTDA